MKFKKNQKVKFKINFFVKVHFAITLRLLGYRWLWPPNVGVVQSYIDDLACYEVFDGDSSWYVIEDNLEAIQ